MPICKYCYQQIEYTTLKATGKPIPVNPDYVTAGECKKDDYLVVDGNITQAGMLRPDTVGRVSHINECSKLYPIRRR